MRFFLKRSLIEHVSGGFLRNVYMFTSFRKKDNSRQKKRAIRLGNLYLYLYITFAVPYVCNSTIHIFNYVIAN